MIKGSDRMISINESKIIGVDEYKLRWNCAWQKYELTCLNIKTNETQVISRDTDLHIAKVGFKYMCDMAKQA